MKPTIKLCEKYLLNIRIIGLGLMNNHFCILGKTAAKSTESLDMKDIFGLDHPGDKAYGRKQEYQSENTFEGSI